MAPVPLPGICRQSAARPSEAGITGRGEQVLDRNRQSLEGTDHHPGGKGGIGGHRGGAGLLRRPERISVQALAKAPCAAIAASINFRAVTRFSRKSRAISISVPESRSPGIVISRDGPEPQTWLSLIRPAVERCVRLLQTVHWNVAAVDPVGARQSDKHDHIRHLEVVPGQYAMLAVSDTGIGMTPDVVEKAFEPFFTTKGFGEGTGLGLSQVYGFIKQSGGHIKIYSEPGEGTTVRLYLPRLPEQPPIVQEDDPVVQPSPLGGQETILVVEDNDEVRAYTTDILRELGYEVFEATEGDTALSLLASEPRIKLLFTDVGLPGPLYGRQIADEARKLRTDLKVLFTTGYAQNAIIHQGRLDPGVQLIVKPLNFSGLAAKIPPDVRRSGMSLG